MFKIKIILLSLILLVSTAWGYINWQTYLKSPAKNSLKITIEIKEGESAAELSKDLKDKKIISHSWLFKRYLSKIGLDKKLLVGIYEMQAGMSFKKVAAVLSDQKTVIEKVLFKEGWGITEYATALTKVGLIEKNDMLESLVGYPAVNYCLNSDLVRPKDFSTDFVFLKDKPKCIGLEGYLFPDTYFFSKDTVVEAVVRKMLDNMDKKLTPELRTEIAQQGKTIHEIITMASLIEAEARKDTDRRLVSDVLWRRLSIGMGLQLDSTVNYLTGNDKPAITLTEKEIDSLYNTYKYRGLPPGPINNPSLSAILAAIYPEKNDNWFFLADKEGVVHFAKTLDEHNALKYKYLK